MRYTPNELTILKFLQNPFTISSGVLLLLDGEIMNHYRIGRISCKPLMEFDNSGVTIVEDSRDLSIHLPINTVRYGLFKIGVDIIDNRLMEDLLRAHIEHIEHIDPSNINSVEIRNFLRDHLTLFFGNNRLDIVDIHVTLDVTNDFIVVSDSSNPIATTKRSRLSFEATAIPSKIKIIEEHKDELGRYHSIGSPAVIYEDSLIMYYIRGVRVIPELGILSAEEWDPRWLLRARNTELRRAVIQVCGWEKFITEIGSTIIHKETINVPQRKETITVKKSWALDEGFTENDFISESRDSVTIKNPYHNSEIEWHENRMELHHIDNADIEPIRLLKVICASTGEIHLLRVPPTVNNCEEARRATLLDPRATIQLLMET